MSLMPFFIVWLLLGLAVATLALMRKSVAAKEDDSIHLSSVEAVAVDQQVAIAKRLDVIDKWGKLLTIVLVATGVILGGAYLWEVWNASSTAGMK